ncbi:MAG: hypothetical protein HY000_11015 [Planctomycetes bacterium]|nr:hypothetical protein [Planctomycetota bacterium]
MITMHNTTEFSYELKLDGIALGRLAPGQHLHVRRQHGRMLIEAVPVSKGLKYSQWLDSHADFVWQLETPRVVSPPAPDKQPRANQSKPKQQSAPTGHVTRNGFYTQFENAGGIMIKAPACVRPQALQEAKRVVERVLQNGPELHKRLAGQGLEIVVFGAKQKITDLPETTHLKGKPRRLKANPPEARTTSTHVQAFSGSRPMCRHNNV